jgi:hypothetical protein
MDKNKILKMQLSKSNRNIKNNRNYPQKIRSNKNQILPNRNVVLMESKKIKKICRKKSKKSS